MKACVKTVISLLLALIMCGCQKSNVNAPKTTEEDTQQSFENICVDVYNSDGAYFSTMANAKLDYSEQELACIYIENPTVLAFRVADSYPNGVGVIDVTDLQDIKQKIADYLNTNKTDRQTKELLSYISDQINSVTILTSAST